MAGIRRILDEVSGITTITTKEIQLRNAAHLSAVFLVKADDVAGRWNVVLELRLDGRTLEIARLVGLEAPGLHALTLTPPLDRQPAPVLEPNFVRYFTLSQNARLSGQVLIVEVV